jgi:hypothetical protein
MLSSARSPPPSLREWAERLAMYLTTSEAAEYLRCLKTDGNLNPNRLHKLASQGRIPHRREGDRLLFVRSELDEWLDSGEAAL